jgi:hypothetical protein
VRKLSAPSSVGGQLIPAVDLDLEDTEEWSGSEPDEDYPLPAVEDHYLPISSDDREDTNYQQAVHDSLREEMKAKVGSMRLRKTSS